MSPTSNTSCRAAPDGAMPVQVHHVVPMAATSPLVAGLLVADPLQVAISSAATRRLASTASWAVDTCDGRTGRPMNCSLLTLDSPRPTLFGDVRDATAAGLLGQAWGPPGPTGTRGACTWQSFGGRLDTCRFGRPISRLRSRRNQMT
jgi:hypothetical protein